MKPERHWLSTQTVIEIDTAIEQVHLLLVKEILAGTATPAVEQAEQKLHDLRNHFAALTGLGFRFAVCDGKLI